MHFSKNETLLTCGVLMAAFTLALPSIVGATQPEEKPTSNWVLSLFCTSKPSGMYRAYTARHKTRTDIGSVFVLKEVKAVFKDKDGSTKKVSVYEEAESANYIPRKKAEEIAQSYCDRSEDPKLHPHKPEIILDKYPPTGKYWYSPHK